MAIPLGMYRHFKGNLYEVIGTAKHSETEESYIVYRAVQDSTNLWIRPESMFIEKVIQDGKEIPRFQYLGVEAIAGEER